MPSASFGPTDHIEAYDTRAPYFDILMTPLTSERCLWANTALSLPVDLCASHYLFDMFSNALNWFVVAVLGVTVVLHYLDDFFAILPFNSDAIAGEQQSDRVCANYKKHIMGTIADFLGIVSPQTTTLYAQTTSQWDWKIIWNSRFRLPKQISSGRVSHSQQQYRVTMLMWLSPYAICSS